MVKVAGLDSDNEKIRQDAATEILDRQIGKPLQKSEVSGAIKTENNVYFDYSKLSAEQLAQLIAIAESAKTED
jgi:hypothetical protein